MNAVTTTAMMGAQFSTGDVEDRIAHLPAQRRLQDIDGCGNGDGRILPLQEVNERFAFGRHLLAEVQERVVPLEPGRIVVGTRHAAPNLPFRFPESERGPDVGFT